MPLMHILFLDHMVWLFPVQADFHSLRRMLSIIQKLSFRNCALFAPQKIFKNLHLCIIFRSFKTIPIVSFFTWHVYGYFHVLELALLSRFLVLVFLAYWSLISLLSICILTNPPRMPLPSSTGMLGCAYGDRLFKTHPITPIAIQWMELPTNLLRV